MGMGASRSPIEGIDKVRTHRAKRNGPCLCGSGEKFKRCCLPKAKATPDCVLFRKRVESEETSTTCSSTSLDAKPGLSKYRECRSCGYVKPSGKCGTGVK